MDNIWKLSREYAKNLIDVIIEAFEEYGLYFDWQPVDVNDSSTLRIYEHSPHYECCIKIRGINPEITSQLGLSDVGPGGVLPNFIEAKVLEYIRSDPLRGIKAYFDVVETDCREVMVYSDFEVPNVGELLIRLYINTYED